MSRGGAAVDALRELLPESVAAAFALVTQLGDIWLYVLILSLLYWYWDRDRAARIVGVALGAVALTLALKHAFALPRPPVAPPALPAAVPAAFEPVYAETVSAESYGFPSGHAVGSAAVWGALALWTDVGTRRQRFAAAGGLVVVISLSRLVLGVHYLVDVVAGVAVGAAYLAGIAAAVDRVEDGPALAFGAATVAGVVAVAVSGGATDPLAAFGAAAGALAAWHLVAVPAEPWPRSTVGVGYALVTAAVLGAVAALWLVVPLPRVAVVAVAALGVGGIIVAPGAVVRTKKA
ncbi:phosphatase PAP2 family protein [Halostella salina]|uniref:phosphatase PAP2 family protein n=1 Tax=Halostella salina TaxID=1547897 RepID=UPI000EF84BE5|nr:phosphatase PAP2 family protein [Halostella salina]